MDLKHTRSRLLKRRLELYLLYLLWRYVILTCSVSSSESAAGFGAPGSQGAAGSPAESVRASPWRGYLSIPAAAPGRRPWVSDLVLCRTRTSRSPARVWLPKGAGLAKTSRGLHLGRPRVAVPSKYALASPGRRRVLETRPSPLLGLCFPEGEEIGGKPSEGLRWRLPCPSTQLRLE